ncbi:MAG: DMT family transporter [Actinomycetota bacterium]|nr:DMT family transporter [Actinomycetota bacterium]
MSDGRSQDPSAGADVGGRSGLGRVSAVGAVLCWSGGNVIVAQFDMPGMAIAFWRLVIGSVVYGAILYASGRRITRANVRLAIPVAVVFALELGLFFTSLHHTSVANATIIGSLQTIVLLAVAARRYRERIGLWLAGLGGIALVGVVVVVLGGDSADGTGLSLRGDLLAVAAMVFFSVYFVLVKEVRSRIDTFTLQTAIMAIGAVVLLPFAAIDAGQVVPTFPSWSQWGWLALLLAIPGTGHFLMNWAHLHVTLSLAGLLTLAVPVLSTFGAWLFLDQRLSSAQALGMAVVLASLVLVVRRDARLQAKSTG